LRHLGSLRRPVFEQHDDTFNQCRVPTATGLSGVRPLEGERTGSAYQLGAMPGT
jgi:hypothetical protein